MRHVEESAIERQVKELMRQEFKFGRVERAIAWMDKHVGYGWKRRMHKVDKYMNQNMPRHWQARRKIPEWKNLRRFEEYCARFGYDMPDPYLPYAKIKRKVPQADVREALDQLHSTLNEGTAK